MGKFKLINTAVFLGLILAIFSCNNSSKHKFEHSAPELKGYSSSKLDTLRNFLDKSGTSSMIILVDGEVIFEWGNTSKKHLIHSIRKALLNSLIGIAVEQGKIDTSMTLYELGLQEKVPELSDIELNARIADLLKSKSGVYLPAAAMSQGMINSLPERHKHRPGEEYYYNNWDFNALGAILEEKTGESIYELFLNEIAKPIGMLDYKGKYVSIDGESEEEIELPRLDGFYQYEKSKSIYPAYHFRMSTRDLALYGQLYLNEGKWNDKQIIPKEWIEASISPSSIYNEQYNLGYGMLWKLRLSKNRKKLVSFYHTGVGIHMLAVYPNRNMVFVHRVDTENEYNYENDNIYKMIELVVKSKI